MFFKKCLYLLFVWFVLSCSQKQESKKYLIGFSQCIESDNWRKTMLEGMRRELSFHPNAELIYREAGGRSDVQAKQVRELLDKKIDVLIISPNEAQPLTPIVEEAFTSGIPVVVVDRKISSPLYTSYVGADNYEVGFLAGEYAANLLKGKGKIIEVMGLPGSSPAIERQKGFYAALKRYPELNIVKQVYGDWTKQKAQSEIQLSVNSFPDVDLVFAHNDVMALGAYEVFKAKGMEKKVKFIGIDGLPGQNGGLQFVSDKVLTATMLYPTGGEEAIQVAMKILQKEKFNKENILQTSAVDSTNVRLMKLQTEKIISQQKDIENQQEILHEQLRIYQNQKTFLNILILTLILTALLGSIAFYSWRENKKINKKLEEQNNKILEQRNKLVEMSEKAEEAHQSKLRFFTNISHEFRTPLTLILAPLEELLSNQKIVDNTRIKLRLVQKNVMRLLRLINQLMNFRKIEFDKMYVQATENDLVAFINEIVESYNVVAAQRNIDLRLITKERTLKMWFDVTLLDKVIFNLLSNAFKFTNDNGSICIILEKDNTLDCVIIKVQDSGIGMKPESIAHAFDLFYQGEHENQLGSGIGLALSKELIELHHGSITVKSEKWKGTTFEIKLPLGRSHFSDKEIGSPVEGGSRLPEDAKLYTTELENHNITFNNQETVIKNKEHTILIIEDNDDLRSYLKERLSDKYQILEASHGNTALQEVYESVPDLIICDVVIPGKDGIALTHTLKTDVRTSHIPIILLTALQENIKQVEGMRSMADAYIVKPFDMQVLGETINSLIRNRERLREHYTSELTPGLKSQIPKKLDKKFINDFAAIVESNISNEDFTVEFICKEIGVSRVQLYRKVKALLGANVNEYILNSRLQKSKHLLLKEDLTISEIAFQVGFSSQAYFSTVFKSKFGVTPSEYREQMTKQQ